MIDLELLSYEEKKAIEELRGRVEKDLPKSILEDISFYHRFLVARDFNIDKAEKMLRKNIEWRKSYQIDTILEDFTTKKFFHKYPKLSTIGLAKDGDLVVYLPAGQLDGRDICKCTTINNYIKHWMWYITELGVYVLEENRKARTKYMQQVLIVNLDKLSLGNATSKQSADICLRLMRMLQDNYPECMKSMYIINSPAYYVIIFNFLKSMLSKAMIAKLHVFGYSGWKEALLEAIDADILPAFLGGNRTDPDGNPLCLSFMRHGGRIPEIYHMPNEERYFKAGSIVEGIVVPQRGRKDIDVEVTESGSKIQWEFLVKSRDIGFGLFYRASEQELQEVLPIQKYDTVDGTESGFYRSKLTGKYIIVFDNSHSWMTSKEIEYCIIVVKQEL